MSLAFHLPLPRAIVRGQSRRGRPRADEDLRQRDLHYKAAGHYFIKGMPIKCVAFDCKVTQRTVIRWLHLALTHDDERTEFLRQVVAKTSRGRKWLKRVKASRA